MAETVELGVQIGVEEARSTELIGFAILALEPEDVEAAEWLHPQIMPLADEVSFNSVTSQGPIAADAGKLASRVGDTVQAERFLLDALATAEAFGWQYGAGDAQVTRLVVAGSTRHTDPTDPQPEAGSS